MVYKISYQTHSIVAESETEMKGDVTFLKIDKVYQLLSVPSNITTMDGSQAMRDVKLLKFDKTKLETAQDKDVTGNAWLNIKDAVEVVELKSIPDLPDISQSELKQIQAEAMKQAQAAKATQGGGQGKY